ncbi:hypothetical protein M758_1G003300 [Ceratodon purpureus]|nr:hypothetical protein M758_1G003300 [Ceratodon purpureus]
MSSNHSAKQRRIRFVQVILVGHSYGGVPVARAIERYSMKIHVAVYIAACMLCSEQPMSEVWPQVFNEFVNDMRFNFGRPGDWGESYLGMGGGRDCETHLLRLVSAQGCAAGHDAVEAFAILERRRHDVHSERLPFCYARVHKSLPRA